MTLDISKSRADAYLVDHGHGAYKVGDEEFTDVILRPDGCGELFSEDFFASKFSDMAQFAHFSKLSLSFVAKVLRKHLRYFMPSDSVIRSSKVLCL